MSEPVNIAELELHAKTYLPKSVWDYYRSGANDEETLKDNIQSFSRIKMRPRVLVGVSQIDLSTKVLGYDVTSPILVAPTAMQRMAHPDGEIATAKACEKAGTIMTLSSWSTTKLEDVQSCSPNGLKWFQLYVYKDRSITVDLIKRAEKSNYKALVLTVDAPILGRREDDVRNGFSLMKHLELSNFSGLGLESMKQQNGQSGLAAYVSSQIDSNLNWNDIKWLKSITSLPIVVKGIQTGEDGRLAVENGASAVWVSNHGARQLDGVMASIDILPQVIKAVDGKAQVYVDGGIRRGTSVAKALAMGATAVFVGRPILWGLSYKGEEGVTKALDLLNNELRTAMQLLGCPSVRDITPAHIHLPTSKM